jgi:SPP1 family holin
MDKVSLGTKIRTAAVFVTLANQVLACFGLSPIPFNSDEINLVTSTVLTGAASVWAWWKNNSFTKAALKGDTAMKAAKAAASVAPAADQVK